VLHASGSLTKRLPASAWMSLGIWLALVGAAGCSGSRRGAASNTPTRVEATAATAGAQLPAISPPTASATLPPTLPPDALADASILAVHFVDPDHGWAVQRLADSPAIARAILYTADGGSSWNILSRIDADVARIDFVDREHGWLATNDGVLRATVDGGESWSVVAQGGSISDISFVSPELGWLVGLGHDLAVTRDGGQTWMALTTPCNDEHLPPKASFQSSSSGVIVCPEDGGAGFEGKRVYSTDDGGVTWSEIRDSIGSAGYFSDLFVLNDADWWYTSPYPVAVLYSTRNAGVSWSLVPLPGGSGYFNWLSDPEFVDATHGWVVASKNAVPPGTILATSDGGKTWAPVAVPAP
jgi:photosystem II stability/assembly factor-like uncharacterized protein